jgi:hypothetical protein
VSGGVGGGAAVRVMPSPRSPLHHGAAKTLEGKLFASAYGERGVRDSVLGISAGAQTEFASTPR